MSALTPCPFCGGEASIISTHAGGRPRSMSVGCDACGCTTPVFDLATALRSEAIAAWNRRARDDEAEKLRAEVAGLETALLAIPGHTELPAHVCETIVLIRERRAALGDTP